MPNLTSKISNGSREDVIAYIVNSKKERIFTVIDVGGSISGWSANIIDALIDFNDPITTSPIRHFKCDITHPDSWRDVLNYVKENGKFDFCI